MSGWTILIFNQPPRSTQPSTLCGMTKWLWIGLDWPGFNVSTNTVWVIRETVLQVTRPNQQHQSTEGKIGQPQTGRGSKPTRGFPPCYKWTSEKRKTLSQWVKPSETKPHTAGWPVQVLYRTIDCATIDATQHFSKTGLGILYPLCTKPTSMMKCG